MIAKIGPNAWDSSGIWDQDTLCRKGVHALNASFFEGHLCLPVALRSLLTVAHLSSSHDYLILPFHAFCCRLSVLINKGIRLENINLIIIKNTYFTLV